MKKLINFNTIVADNRKILDEPIINLLARKNIYFSNGQKYNQLILNQLIGNLGGDFNHQKFSTIIDFYIIGSEYMDNMEEGKDLPEELRKIEKTINSRKLIYDCLLLISEEALIDYIKWRSNKVNDISTQKYLNQL